MLSEARGRRAEQLIRDELSEKPHVIVKKDPDIINAVFQHGDSLNAHAKSKSGDPGRVVADIFKHGGMDHAGAENLEPSGLGTDPTPFSSAHDTENIDLGAGFGERERSWVETSAWSHHQRSDERTSLKSL